MDNKKCKSLIQQYKTSEVLWNAKNSDYYNKAIRENAWKRISEELKLPVNHLKRKMTILLASYRREKSRIKKSFKTVSGSKGVYKSKWFAYKDFDFMSDKNTPNFTADTLPDEPATQNDTNILKLETQNTVKAVKETTPLEEPLRKKARTSFRTEAESGNNAMLTQAFDILKSSAAIPMTDPYFSFGQHIANELRKYDSNTVTHVKHAINNIIFEADLGRFSHRCRSTTTSISQEKN